MKTLLLLTLGLMAVYAQRSGPLGFDAELRRHLELTDEQVRQIEANNRDLETAQRSQSERLIQLAAEAREELAKQSPDAMAVGSRCAEQESIFRAQAAATKRALERNRAVLTPAQRQRLDALQESARLISVINEAQSANLYRQRGFFIADPFFGGGSGFAIPFLNFGTNLGFRSGCTSPGIIPVRIVLP